MSERLEEIKERFNAMTELESFRRLAPTDLFFDDLKYLIQQAEHVRELEGRLKVSEANNDILKHEIEESEEIFASSIQINRLLRSKSQHYKQALEEILGLDIDVSIYDYAGDVITIAAEALKGDKP